MISIMINKVDNVDIKDDGDNYLLMLRGQDRAIYVCLTPEQLEAITKDGGNWLMERSMREDGVLSG